MQNDRADPILINWLTAQLSDRNWSQNELARRAGISKGVISEVMNGRRPGIEACKAIAHALGIAAEIILVLAGHLPAPPGYDREAEELLHLFGQMSDRDQAEMLKIAQMKLESEQEQGGAKKREKAKG